MVWTRHGMNAVCIVSNSGSYSDLTQTHLLQTLCVMSILGGVQKQQRVWVVLGVVQADVLEVGVFTS